MIIGIDFNTQPIFCGKFFSYSYDLFFNGFIVSIIIRSNHMEKNEMTDYKETYEELKKNINEDNSKIIAFLILGVLAGRVYENFKELKKMSLRVVRE